LGLFCYFLTCFKTIQKIRDPIQGRIREFPKTKDNIIHQLAVICGGLFFVWFVSSSKQIVHCGVVQCGHVCEMFVSGFCFSAFPVGHGRRTDAQ